MMNKTKKNHEIVLKSVDIKKDIAQINKYALKELLPDEVFAFPVILCDNEIDRDGEKFTDHALKLLAPLFIGKSGIFDHEMSAKNQVARIYKTEIEQVSARNEVGEPLKRLKGWAYMLRTDATNEYISKIEAGILKEVSVGFGVNRSICSVCGGAMGYFRCAEGHEKGMTYEGVRCYGILDEPHDAYEFSFVAVPAQRGAGVTKAVAEDVKTAFDILNSADLSNYKAEIDALFAVREAAKLDETEKEKRAEILRENEKYLEEQK